MSNLDQMRDNLPDYYQESPEFNALIDVGGGKLDIVEREIEDVLYQFFIDTATWGLDRWENIFKIPIDHSKPYDQRRSVIKAKMRGIGKVDAALIKNVADSYTNGDVDVRFDGRIIIKFNSVLGTPPNLQDLQNAIEDIKPGGKRVIYEFAYLLIQDIHNKMKIDQLQVTTLDKFAGGG